MTNIRQYKITFKNIKEGEIPCDNPTIKIIGTTEGVVQKCEFKNNSVTFSIFEDAIDGLQGKCINFVILCETCGKCKPKTGKLCFCNDFTDCEDCQDCINGVCVNRCPDMVCVDGKCQNCADNEDCAGNLECIGGKCTCPPTLPYYDEVAERCYGCQTDNECGPCYRCIDGNCVKLNCVCDEDLDKCVECVAASDCPLPNQCCVGNKCVCCPGYIWNPVLGECVPKPPCTGDDDLDPCQICVDGEIQDIVCPDPTKVCIDGQCVDIPCDGACDDATDCGPNCGCLNGQCVDCASLDCVTCAQTIGCKCVNGECEKDNDPCSQYSCDTNCGDRPDCGCQPDGSCEEVACEGESTLVKDDCQLVYNLETTKCCGCPSITLDNKIVSGQINNIQNKLILFNRVEVRKGAITSPFGILDIHRVDEDQYDDIMSNEEPTQGVVQVSATYIYEGLSGGGNPTGIFTTENVLLSPTYDVAGVGFSQQAISINIPGRQYPTGLRVLRSVTLTYTLISELTFESECVYSQGTIIGSYTFDDSFRSEVNWVAEFNKDTPGQDTNAEYWIAKTVTSDACRVPEALWYKAPADSEGNITTFEVVPFRKAYLTKLTPTNYTDFIDEPDENPGPTDNNGELFSGYYYKVATDCACTNEATAYYESTCENPGRLVFCDPLTADITFDACGKKITFNESFITTCLPNYDYYGDNADFVPDEAQLRYSIHVNGSETALTGSTKIADINGLIYNAGQVFTATELIEYIEIKLSHDNCDECTIRIDSDVDKDLPSYSVVCEPSGVSNTTFIITFTGWTGITSVTVNSLVATSGSPTINVTVVNGTTSLTGAVQFTGCPGTLPMTIQLPENCCDDLLVNLVQGPNACGVPVYSFTATSSPNISGTYTFNVDGVFNTSNTTGLLTLSTAGDPDIVAVSFNPDAGGCENVINSVEINKQNSIVINSDIAANYSTCGTSDVTITYSTLGYSGDLTYTISGIGSTNVNLDGTETLTILVPYLITGRTVTVTNIDLQDENANTCISFSPNITNITWVETPTVSSVTIVPSSGCEGEAVTVTVNGTIGGTATINSVNFLGVTPTTVNMNTPYIFYLGSSVSNLGIASVTAVEAKAGTCEETVNVGDTATVNDAPVITSVTDVCTIPGNPSSNFDITVIGTAGATVTASADEGNVALVESPAGTYTGEVDSSNGGDSITINMVLGSCSDSEVYPLVNCACDEDFVAAIQLGGDTITNDSGCVGEVTGYTSLVTAGNSPFSYEWRLNHPTSGTLLATTEDLDGINDYTFVVGVNTLYLRVIDDEGCEAVGSITVTGNPLPTVTVTGDLSPCLNEATNYTAPFTNGPISNYYWFIDNITPSIGVDTPDSTSSIFAYTATDTSAHTITVVVVNSNGCQSVESTLTATAVDCCEICATTETEINPGVDYNRLRDTDNTVHILPIGINFECVDVGDPSAANDTAAGVLQTFLEGLGSQCGTPVVSWESFNVGDATDCLSESFSVVSGTNGLWFRGVVIDGTTYTTNYKIAEATAGTVTSVTGESTLESYTASKFDEEGVGILSVNYTIAIGAPTTEVDIVVEITGTTGSTLSVLFATTSGGVTSPVAVNNVACIGLGGGAYATKCIKLIVEDSSIVPAIIYNSANGFGGDQAGYFVGPCNPV
jgi:hypothetical protein